MLALAGGALRIAALVLGSRTDRRVASTDFPRLNEIHIDWRVLVFTLAASLLTGFLFGLAPALGLAKSDVQEAMKESGRGTAGGVRSSRLRHALIVTEVALSVVLLAGAGLLFRSFLQLQSVNAGFTPQQVLTARLTPSGTDFRTDADFITFYDNVLQRLREVPGVQYAGIINTLPLS